MSNRRKEEDDDEEALWLEPGRDNLPEGTAVSPWRAPASLRQTRDVGET